jgi:hypothetical protein
MERRKIYEETLQCGFKRCCPTVHVFDDGSVELSDDDTEAGSVGTIKIRPEAAQRLLKLLSAIQK